MNPRDYQVLDVDELRRSFKNHRAVIYRLPTGGGKTVVAGLIAQGAARLGTSVLALVHRRELVRQFCATLDKFGLAGQYGVIAAGRTPTPWAKFQVASIQTLHRREYLKLDPGIVFIDECHHVKARTWEEVIGRFQKAQIIGLSATPKRLDGKPLGDIFGHIIHGPEITDLVARGYLARTLLKWPKHPLSTKGIRRLAGDFSRAELGKRIDRNVVVSAVNTFFRHDPTRLTIFFGVNIPHSQMVAAEFRDRGISAEHVDGHTDDARRDYLMNEFSSGNIRVLCNVDIVSEGTDVPMCSSILDAAPTESLVRYQQRAGRAMRPDHGLDALYLDCAGNFWRHGAPDEVRTWDLETTAVPIPPDNPRSPARRLRCCPKCLTVFKARLNVCPECGHDCGPRPPKEIDMELIGDVLPEGKQSPPTRKRSATGDLRRDLRLTLRRGAKADDIREIGVRHGMPPNWADTTIEILGM